MIMIDCAFYGTLRKPFYNYNRMVRMFTTLSVEYMKTVKVDGFDMYILDEGYPAIKCAKPNRKIVVDLFRISRPAYDWVYAMESGAGYYEDDIIIDGKPYMIFPYKGEVKEENLIENGDFLSYKNQKSINSHSDVY